MKYTKHKNKLTITFDYNKESPVPHGIEVETHCTILDMVLALIRLFEVTHEKAESEGKDITSFIANCAAAYAATMDRDEDNED